MASTVLNFIVENYLSNFIEINPNQTKASLWSGEVQMSNVKIKKELFQTMNIPFFEVVHGYIGSIKITMSMPMFYKYPIKVQIENVFFHARQKDINEINKEEEIKNMEAYKLSTLDNQEILKSQLNQIDKEESSGMQKQIINNLHITIKNVIFRYDDNVSYKKIPYSLGLILEHLSLRSTKSDFKIPSNPDEIIQCEEESFKVISMKNLSFFWDCFSNENELRFNNLIENSYYNTIKNEIKQYLGPQLDFYVYCLSEVGVHSRNRRAHQYILHNINMELKATINENINKNLKPEYIGDLEFPSVVIDFSLKQIETILKVLSYMNLSSLYHEGLAKEFYKKELSDEEKQKYIKEYVIYFHQKYDLHQNVTFPESLQKMQEGLSLFQIQLMRSASLKKSGFFKEKAELEKKIKEQEGKFFFRDEKLIKKLKSQLQMLKDSEQKYNQSVINELENKDAVVEIDYLMNLPDSYLRYVGNFRMKQINLVLHENVSKKSGGWIYKGKIIEIEFVNYSLNGEFFKKGMTVKMSLEDTKVTQDKIKNPNYSTILFGDVNTKGKILDIEFIMNPNLPCSDMKFTMKAERGIYIICDLYVLQYIQYKVMKVLSTSINFNEIANYAKDSVSQYIQTEYANNFLKGNYQHTNIYLDLVFYSPIIILPLNIFDNDNTNCIKLTLGKFKGFSKLPPRMKPDIDYKRITDESLLFDIYEFDLQGGQMSTVTNCTFANGYQGENNMLLKEFDMSITCNILIETKNLNFPNIKILIKIPIFDFHIDEFQILFFIDYLGNLNAGNNKLSQETYNDSIQQYEEKKEIEKFMKRKSTGEIKFEEENLKYLKKRMEEFDQKLKLKQKENRYKQFIRSYSSVVKKNNLLNAFDNIEKGKKTLYVLLEFNEAKFTIKKNYTDLTSEEYLIYDQKLLEIEYFIVESGDMLVKLVIKDIGLFDKDKNEISNKGFDESDNNIINTNEKHLKKYLLSDNFTCLIKSSQQMTQDKAKEMMNNNINFNEPQKKEGFIIIKYLYQVELQYANIDIIMNNLNITISYDSLKRMYQFSMYYLDKYLKMMEESNLLYKNPNKVNPEDKEEYLKELKIKNKKDNDLQGSFTEGIKKDLSKQLPNYISKLKKAKINKSNKNNNNEDALSRWVRKFKEEKNEKKVEKENLKNNLKVKFTMKDTTFTVPLYPQDSETPLVSFFFSMIYNQEWTNEFENIYSLPNKTILETNYFTQDSKMNLTINKLNLDVTFPSDKRRIMMRMKKKILNDLRVYIEVSMSIIPKYKQSLIITDIVLEPLLMNLTVKQLVYLMEFYNISMKFLNYDMAEKYIPLMKPEYLIHGIPKRNKMSFKKCFKRIVLAMNMQKKLKKELKTLKKKEGEKKENVNTLSFSSYIECNVKIDQIGVTFFDTDGFRQMALFTSDISNLSVKFISNSQPKDKLNMGNAILEMITATEEPIEKYNKNNLGMYLDVFCTFEANYHNTVLSEFEPLLEKVKLKVLMYQVASFMRNKCFVNIDEMLNFNISSNAVKALNLFLLKYSEESEDMEIFKDNIKVKKKPKSTKSLFNFNNRGNFPRRPPSQRMVTNKDGAVISVFNHTGVELSFSFESNPYYVIGMKPGELMAFSKADLKNARGIEDGTMSTNMNTIRVSIMRSETIKGINFNHNNTSQYKLKVMRDDKTYTIYFNVKVKTQGIVKRIIFSSSLSIYNDTIYDSIFIMINDKTIPRNEIEIPKERRRYIPISWFLCETPNSEVRIKFSPEGESYLAFLHISEIFSEPLDKKIIKENLDKKLKTLKKYEDSQNFETKDIIEKIKNDANNIKKSKILEIKDEESSIDEKDKNKKKYLCFDYYIYQSKGVSELLMPKDEDDDDNYKHNKSFKRRNSNLSEMINMKNSEIQFSYEFFVYVRPCLTFINSLPFDLNIIVNDFKQIKLEKNKSENIYNYKPDSTNNNNMSIKIILDYYEKKYKSDYNIPDTDLVNIELFELENENSEKKNFSMVKLPKEVELESDIKYTLNIKGFSCLSYNIIYYCEYIINNRLPYPIWYIPCDKKGLKSLKGELIGTRQKQLPNNRLSFISLNSKENKFIIRSENSKWSNPFDINTIGVNGAITIDDQVENIRKQTSTKSKDIACLISKSQRYNKSVVIIFEQRYILINNLGFDIYYKQENDVEIELKDQKEAELFYINKKRIYRLGLYNSEDRLINFSQQFSADNVSDIDLSIRIAKSDLPKYEQFKNSIYTNNNKDYYILIRIVNKTYDDGTFYLLIFLPIFPFLEIINATDTNISIYETDNSKEQALTIEPYLERNKFPYVWKNSAEQKDNLYFEIYGYKQIFSFAKLEKEIITINGTNTKLLSGEKYISYQVYRKNKGQTRVIKITEISKEKKEEKKFMGEIYLLQRKRPISSLYSVQLKGIGFSIINEVPKELFYISFYDIKIKYLSNFYQTNFGTKTKVTENIELYIKNFQIDYCLNDSFKNIIFPSKQMIPSIEEELEANDEVKKIQEFVPFLSMLVTRQNSKDEKNNEEISFYKQIDLVMQEFNIKVEQYALTCLLELINEIMSFFDYAAKLEEKKKEKEETEKILEAKIPTPLEKLCKENEDLERMTINILMIGCLKFNITVRLDLSELNISILPRPIMRILGSVGNSMTRITDGKLKFSEKIFTNIYKNTTDIMWELINHYSKEGIKQIYRILGSTDLIGNPVNFIEGLGNGFFELVNEPRKGFLLGPKQFGKGLLKGLGGVLSGIVGGTFGVVQRISGTLYGATQSMTDQGRDYIMEEEDEPTNIITGVGKGLYDGLKEIAGGFTGIFTQPYKNYKKKKSVKSLVTGIGSGLFRFLISPFAAVFKFIYSVSAGTKNTITTISGKSILVTTRFRHPRVMIGGDEPIHCYESTLAEAKELLWRIQKIETDYIYYAKYFVSGDKGFNSMNKYNIHKMCMVIITDAFLFVIYNSSKVIFKLEMKKIHSCTLHFVDGKYILAFKLENKQTKGFRLETNYALIACQINDMFGKMDLGKNIKAVYTIKAPPGIYSTNKKEEKNEAGNKEQNKSDNFKNDDDDKIDKSSYNQTLVDNDSVITFDNDKTKLSDIVIENENNNRINGLNKRGNYIISTNDAQSKSSRKPLNSKNDEDIILDVKNIK